MRWIGLIWLGIDDDADEKRQGQWMLNINELHVDHLDM